MRSLGALLPVRPKLSVTDISYLCGPQQLVSSNSNWKLTGTLSSLNTNVVGTSSPTRKHVVTRPGRRTSGTQIQIKYANLNDLCVHARAAVFHMKNSTFKGNPILLAMKLRFPFTKTYGSKVGTQDKMRGALPAFAMQS